MTYFLEKNYILGSDGQLHKDKYCYALIRPCKWDYSTVLKWMHGEMESKQMLMLEGQVAMYNLHSMPNEKPFSSIEEFLINVELYQGISPDFEEMRIRHFDSFNNYVVKTIDLHTKKVMYDNVDATIKKLTKQWIVH